MSQNIDDILSIFRVFIHPDTILVNDSELMEKKIGQYIDQTTINRQLDSTRGTMHVSLLNFEHYRRHIDDILRKNQRKIEDIRVIHGHLMLFDPTAKILSDF